MNDDELWSNYRQVVFRLIDALPQETHFVIITADYPQGRVLPEALRKQCEVQLYKTLRSYSEPCRLYGCSKDLKHCELSFASSNITLAEALSIARAYKQNAIYRVLNNQLYLHACLMTYKSKAKLGAFSERVVAI